MKSRSLFARAMVLALMACVSLSLTACGIRVLYKYEPYNFAGRVVPPSGLQQRVMVAYTSGGAGGALELIDGLRDIRSNVQNTIPRFAISGYSGAYPIQIFNYPEQQFGYVLDYNNGTMTGINYASETAGAAVGSFGPFAPSAGASANGAAFAGATANGGVLALSAGGGSYGLNLPNVNKVFVNNAGSIILAMTRNDNKLYRVVQLPISSNPVTPPGAVDCQPLLIPLYCVVPVTGTAFDRPVNAVFSNDGASVYVLNSGPESGGVQASVTVLSSAALVYNNVPTSLSYPSPLQSLPVANPIPVPGGATIALSDGVNLYVAGQSTRDYTTGATLTNTASAGLFTGYLTRIPLSTYVASAPVSISDGTHTRLLFADNNTLWAGSTACANGKRQAVNINYNCLTRIDISGATPAAQIVPAVTPGGPNQVPYPNENGNAYYYGDLNGICWIQTYNKVYTGYGGQIHAFNTVDGSEINNFNITVPGTVLDVAYLDALTNEAN